MPIQKVTRNLSQESQNLAKEQQQRADDSEREFALLKSTNDQQKKEIRSVSQELLIA